MITPGEYLLIVGLGLVAFGGLLVAGLIARYAIASEYGALKKRLQYHPRWPKKTRVIRGD